MLVKLIEREDNDLGNKVIVQTLSYRADEFPTTEGLRKAKIRKAIEVVRKGCGQESLKAFKEIVPHIPTDELDYAAWAYVEHSRLSEQALADRKAVIDRVILEIVGPADNETMDECHSRSLKAHMTMASFLYPMVCLEAVCRVFCANHLRYLAETDQGQVKGRQLLLCRPFCDVDQGSDNRQLIETFVVDAFNYLSLEELGETGNAVAQILRTQEDYQAHLGEMDRMFSRLPQTPFMRRRGQAVRAMVGKDYNGYKEALDDLWAEANEEHQKYYADQLRIIHWMIENQVPTQPIAKAQGDLLQHLRDTAERDALSVIKSVDESIQEESDRQKELQHAQSQRIIAALLADIEEKPKFKAKTTRSKTGRKKTQQPRRTKTSNKRQNPKIKVVESDVSKDPLPGLMKYLDFVSHELRRLKSRLPDDDEAYTGVLDNIDSRILSVDTLLESQETDTGPYIDLAKSSDQFLSTVRSEISALEQHLAETTAFEKDLRLAVQKETIAYGRNNGGRLRRGLGGLTWSDVSDRFHNKMLGSVAEFKHGGSTRLLAPDEALAYYVTMSSLSGFDFDISCHYWQRRPGSDVPPADGNGFMSREGWYDTHVPCFVLHVPFDD